MGKLLNPFITDKDISKTLELNGFKGVYIVPHKLFILVVEDLNSEAFFSIVNKVVIVDEDAYLKDPSIVKHELCHAYLNHKIYRKINLDIVSNIYGRGIEEGICSVFQTIDNLDNIGKVRPRAYIFQSRLFQQLNVLYNYTTVKEHPNLLIHALKEPRYFLSLIRDIYYDILKNNISSFDKYVDEISAHLYVDFDNLDKILYEYTHIMNSLYLTIADSDIYNGSKTNDLFSVPKGYILKSEQKMLFQILNIDYDHESKWLDNLDFIHMKTEEMLSSVEDIDYENSKTKILGR